MNVRVVVMGVAGSGKTTIGEVVADRLDARFLDADSVHPQENVDKMEAGEPLTDADRWPWLRRLADELAGHDRIVLACSALKRRYRDVLRAASDVRFVFLDVDRDTAHERTEQRSGHYMGSGMVASQFEALERPDADEPDAVVIDGSEDVETTVEAVLRALR